MLQLKVVDGPSTTFFGGRWAIDCVPVSGPGVRRHTTDPASLQAQEPRAVQSQSAPAMITKEKHPIRVLLLRDHGPKPPRLSETCTAPRGVNTTYTSASLGTERPIGGTSTGSCFMITKILGRHSSPKSS
jgi:hypothetical protein